MAVDKAEQLAAFLLKQYGWGTDRLKRHYDASRKHCPRRILDEGLWTSFVEKTASYIGIPEKRNYLRKGDSGDEVKQLQQNLIKLGYNCGAAGADGIFGNATEKAVKAFQKDNGLTEDALAGEKTQNQIKNLLQNKSSAKYYIQVGAYGEKDNANVMVKLLKKKGFSASIRKVSGFVPYRVQVGTYSTKNAANTVVKKLKTAGFDAMVKSL